jgi:hypothetical protein
MMLYPSCSEWAGRLGKGRKQLYIDTATFPNHGLEQALYAVKSGFDINDIEWENQGGGADGEYLEKVFKMANIIHKQKLVLKADELQIVENALWHNEETDLKDKRLDKVMSKIHDVDTLFMLCGWFDGFDKLCLENRRIPAKTRDKLREKLLLKAI